ncbi:hypothetical protein [Serratia sp. Se-RSBMAAmG]|uniref:hypothetical protein n=1 Tax=Serratia sp. Se-RSBMAAmG TaxID=3043305 RepID=UPI0024AF0F6D|nr:hypothetical protein [Serratia sp. Se-RSBMAAmG]MDI6977219.1 hypothetical protein [Serratia sp. Se-RSBMAAmG]
MNKQNARNDKIRKKWREGYLTKVSIGENSVVVHASIDCDGNSRMIAKSKRGAKKFVRTRIRANAKAATRKLVLKGDSDI